MKSDLHRLPQAIVIRAAAAIESLAVEPRGRGVLKLVDGEGYRLRFGSYRILFDIDDVARVVSVVRVIHRRDAYRR